MDLADALEQIKDLMPAQELVTLYRRKVVNGVASDSYFPGVPVPNARMMDQDWVLKNVAIEPAILNRGGRVWELYGPSQFPNKDDYLTDARGDSWVIEEVRGVMNGLVARCVCVKKRS